MTIDGQAVIQRKPPAPQIQKSIHKWMDTPERETPGYWVMWWAHFYAYREHTGDITYWTTKGA